MYNVILYNLRDILDILMPLNEKENVYVFYKKNFLFFWEYSIIIFFKYFFIYFLRNYFSLSG